MCPYGVFSHSLAPWYNIRRVFTFARPLVQPTVRFHIRSRFGTTYGHIPSRLGTAHGVFSHMFAPWCPSPHGAIQRSQNVPLLSTTMCPYGVFSHSLAPWYHLRCVFTFAGPLVPLLFVFTFVRVLIPYAVGFPMYNTSTQLINNHYWRTIQLLNKGSRDIFVLINNKQCFCWPINNLFFRLKTIVY